MSKSDFRNDCLKRLKALSPYTKKYRDAKIRSLLEDVLNGLRIQRILFYWPMGFEADLRKTVYSLRPKKDVYLPFMDGVSFKMVPFRYPLEHKAFGIYEPRDSYRKYNLIDVAIVPVVGVDGSLRRIGFGKGMYDRFFPTLKTKPFTIFIQSCACRTMQNVCDDYDVQGDLLITPHGVQSMRKTNVKRTTRRGRSRPHQRVGRIFNFKKDYRNTI
ncbi:5-formyltetrahydrofolate cyclo-ligase [Sulfuricurvum kujiense DSM 16994]|uniref:5-formyltetrahydrofolate cyclo-ligase n=1 Tax=Sulfuricurvum kujiense (strain ATCC BAA-921 / DSM 16994 / JCM 11577 / YK-1) TaxID=709032 RepID=E4U065_SULKY|nr:5-formyltetrahydrofolate cyclo-ligase [Sulfuricurvum kujiense]ADR34251.1 5-formyltetrahydrofolate cyclo-ligase [Sulfuricurvum kujiense DSM 16994]